MSGQSEYDHARLRESLFHALEKSIPEQIRLDERVTWELQEGLPYSVILERAEEKDVGLIIVNLHGEHAVEPEVTGSTADRVIRGSHRPVLSLPIIRP